MLKIMKSQKVNIIKIYLNNYKLFQGKKGIEKREEREWNTRAYLMEKIFFLTFPTV